MAPTSAPTPSVPITTSGIGSSTSSKSANAVKLASAKVEPTLRSMPPEMSVMPMASATKPNSPKRRISDWVLSQLA